MTAKPQTSGLVIVAGAGAGLGQALMRKFKSGGYDVVGISRSARTDAPVDLEFIRADLADASQAAEAVNGAIEKYGAPRIVIHNTKQLLIRPFIDTTDQDFETSWKSMVLAGVHLARATFPSMAASGGGSFLVSGATASLRGGADFSAFSSAKFALRGLTQSLARGWQKKGIHVAHIAVDGIIDIEQGRTQHGVAAADQLNPDDIAETYWMLAHQPKSAWTHELDLRPMTERF